MHNEWFAGRRPRRRGASDRSLPMLLYGLLATTVLTWLPSTAAYDLYIDDRFTFDGTHSDYAQQFYQRYRAGDKLDRITGSVPGEVHQLLSKYQLEFAKLNPFLQRAVLWDAGYAKAGDRGYTKIYVKCGLRMSEMAISLNGYQSQGCTEQKCSSPNGLAFHQSLYCSGYQMGNVSLCATTDGTAPVHAPMWSDGGTEETVPENELFKHEWTEWNDTSIKYVIYAIHLVGDKNSYGKCSKPSMTIPCVVYDQSSDWCSPARGNLVQQWLTAEKRANATSPWMYALLFAAIAIVVVFTVIGYRRVTRSAQPAKPASATSSDDEGTENSDPLRSARESAMYTTTKDLESGNRDGTPYQGAQYDSGQSTEPSERTSDASTFHVGHQSGHHSGQHNHLISDFTTGVNPDLESPNDVPIMEPSPTFSSFHEKKRHNSGATDQHTLASSGIDSFYTQSQDPLQTLQNDDNVVNLRVPFMDIDLTRLLTKGAFGEVWLARLQGKLVAVKRLLPEKRNKMRELEVFAGEIQLMASFNHPNIVTMVGVAWNTLQNLCFVLEFMERGDLQRFLNSHGKELSWKKEKHSIAVDVARGLAYLHGLEHKIIHRDLKSKNILIQKDIQAKLSDFGISRMREGEETLTCGVGTPYWSAPEVLSGGKYSEKADIYSLGVVLSELDTCELPFQQDATTTTNGGSGKMQAIRVMQLVVLGKLKPSFTPECPSGIRALADWCLSTNPEERPTAAEVVELLEDDQTPYMI